MLVQLGHSEGVGNLRPQNVAGTLLPNSLANAYGGHPPKTSELCLPQPDTVPLSNLGYNLIRGLKDLSHLTFRLPWKREKKLTGTLIKKGRREHKI